MCFYRNPGALLTWKTILEDDGNSMLSVKNLVGKNQLYAQTVNGKLDVQREDRKGQSENVLPLPTNLKIKRQE
jgi:hypothetical protein